MTDESPFINFNAPFAKISTRLSWGASVALGAGKCWRIFLTFLGRKDKVG